jgi:predicted TIM-barrel fold metal-dependent hydrolase
MIDVSAYLGPFAFRQLRHNTVGGLLLYMDRFGIEQAVVANAAAIAYRNPQPANISMGADVKAHRDRLISFAVLSPAYAGWRDDLKICHQQLGTRGVRLFPRWHNYKLTDPQCRAFVDAATELGLLISIPVRVEDRRQGGWLVDIPDVDLEEIAALVRACPKARFIISNGTGFANSTLGRPNNGLPENYFLEIGRLNSEFDGELGKLLGILGPDRLLFGTSMPFHYPGGSIARLELLEASEEIKNKIRRGNARRLLGLGGA